MGKHNTFAVAAILAMVLICGSASAQSLGELVEQESLGWVIGRWTAETDQGGEISLTYRWVLDKHAIAINFAMGEYKYQGMIAKMPGYEDKVIEGGADNMGNMVKGQWAPEGEDLVSTTTRYLENGEVMTAALVHTKGKRRTMKIAMYNVTDGVRADESWGTLEFKRQPRQPKKKTEEK